MIDILDNFLTAKQLFQITEYVNNSAPWAKTQDLWNERFINLNSIQEPKIIEIVNDIVQRIQTRIEDRNNCKIIPETVQLVRWRPGDKLDPPHADAEQLDGSTHPYPNRHYSALVYLNNTFKGGQIFFPKQQLRPVISPGLMVNFTGTVEHLHGVTEVTAGMRYTIVVFFTRVDND